MARRHSRGSGSGMKNAFLSNHIIVLVGAIAIGVAVYGLYKGHKNQERASSAYFMPFSHPNKFTLNSGRYTSPFAGQLSGMTLGGQQEVGPEEKILKHLLPGQISSDIRYTLNRFSDSEAYTSGSGSATTVSALGRGSRLAMHGENSYQRDEGLSHANLPPPSIPNSIKVSKITIAGAPEHGNDYIGGVAIGYRPVPRY